MFAVHQSRLDIERDTTKRRPGQPGHNTNATLWHLFAKQGCAKIIVKVAAADRDALIAILDDFDCGFARDTPQLFL